MTTRPPTRTASRRNRNPWLPAIAAVLLCPGTSGAAEDPRPRSAAQAASFAAPTGSKQATAIGTYRTCHIEFSDEEAARRALPCGVREFCRLGRFVDAFLEIQDDAAIEALEARLEEGVLRWYELGPILETPPPPPAQEQSPTLGGFTSTIVRNGFGGLTGEGVWVAVVDTGVDYRHPDFWKPGPDCKPVSKLVAYWDTTAAWQDGQALGEPAPLRLPDGRPLGVVYRTQHLNAALGGAQGLPETLKAPDASGHGTACAGLAAGYGHLDPRQFAGVAPEAALVAVRIGRGNLPNAALLNAICAWLDEQAAEHPLVISCSFAGQYGGRDGQTVFERHLSARIGRSRPGRLFCIAAGNEGDTQIHAGLILAPGSSVRFRWSAKPQAPFPGSGHLELWVRAGQTEGDGDDDELLEADLELSGALEGIGPLSRYYHPLSECVVIKGVVVAGGEMTLANRSTAPGRRARRLAVDVYLSGDFRYAADGAAPFLHAIGNRHQVGYPGCAEGAITVGSYDFQNRLPMQPDKEVYFNTTQGKVMRPGTISSYSNGGPLRLRGVPKPTVVAPGQWYLAPAVGDHKAKMKAMGATHHSGRYALFNGTSAATPYVAGLFALVLQGRPRLSQAEAMEQLREHAAPQMEKDLWGYGKLDFASCSELLKAVVARGNPAR